MATKSSVKTAKDILDRFYRDAEGRTNRQLDVYFIVEDLGLAKDKAETAIEFLVSRGLVNAFGPDIAFLTDAGADAVRKDADINELPKVARDFNVVPPQPASQTEDVPKESGSAGGGQGGKQRARPNQPFLMHIAPEGEETKLSLGWICTIGRQDGNDVRVNDQRASKRHAEIFYRDGQYFLRDLNSANGTLMNGDYVVEDMALKHDDEIVIGRTMILFQAPEVIPRPKGPEPVPGETEEPATVVPVTDDAEPPLPTERPAKVPNDPTPIRVVRGAKADDPRRRTGEMAAPSVTQAKDEEPLDLFADEPKPAASRAADPDLFAEGPTKAEGDDLFASEAKTGDGDDLFADSKKKKKGDDDDLFADSKKKKKSEDDLFADSKKKKSADDDLFVDAKKKKKGDDDDLFADTAKKKPAERPTSRAKTDLEAKPKPKDAVIKPPPRIDSDARLMAELTGEVHSKRTEPLLEVVEPLPIDALTPAAPTDSAAAADFDEPTPTDGVLDNQPVRDEEEPKDESTVMTTRDALFKAAGEKIPDKAEPEEDLIEELPTWGEPARPAASAEGVPAPKAGKVELYGEEMPDASPSLINLKAVKRGGPPPDEALSEAGVAFRDTLTALRKRAEHADLPDRKELLAAIDLLEKHPYIRVALKLVT